MSGKAKGGGSAKEIMEFQDEGIFRHRTGDKYDGGFEIKKKDRSLKMSGFGLYTTHEGDVYCGKWENDCLTKTEDIRIQFHEGANYEGMLKDWCYNGPGTYSYPDNSKLQCEFNNNCPDGSLVLTDPNGHIWLANAGQGFAWFEPSNHYYEFLERIYESQKAKRRRSLKEGMTDSENWVPNASNIIKKKNK